MKIMLDANAFCGDFRRTGNAFRVFREGIKRSGDELIVPRVVVEEVVNKYRERLEQHVQDLAKLSHENKRLLGQPLRDVLSEGTFTEEVRKYRDFFEQTIREVEGKILPYPGIPHEELVRRALARRKPFKRGDAGYRDALIWQSILNVFRESKEKEHVYFVTANKADFGEGPMADQDLLEDLDGLGISRDSVQIYGSLENLNQDLILPTLKRLDEMIGRLGSERVGKFSLEDWITKGLLKELRDGDLDDFLAPVEPSHAHIYLGSIKKIESIKVDDVRLLPKGNLLVQATAELSAIIVIDVNWEDMQHEDVRELFGEDETPFTYASVDLPVRARVGFSLILDGTRYDVVSSEIDDIEGEFATLKINPHPRGGVLSCEHVQQENTTHQLNCKHQG